MFSVFCGLLKRASEHNKAYMQRFQFHPKMCGTMPLNFIKHSVLASILSNKSLTVSLRQIVHQTGNFELFERCERPLAINRENLQNTKNQKKRYGCRSVISNYSFGKRASHATGASNETLPHQVI